MFAITDEPIDTDAVLLAVRQPAAGAELLFVGTVRDRNVGRSVDFLEYEAYEPMAIKLFEAIRVAVRASHGEGVRLAIVHRVGRVTVGEPSVAIAVSSAHRDVCYSASRDAIERLKRDAPIWKKEHFEGGEVWIEGPGAPFAPA